MSATQSFKHLNDQIETMKAEVDRHDSEFLEAWSQFSKTSKKQGALSVKDKELICVALSIAARCSYCIASHVSKAITNGATREQILEVSYVAVSMGGGPSFAYMTEVIQACDEFGAK
jgi:AhpD family alkylhydroperoxidase